MSTDRFEPVAILWDFEDCCVPKGVSAEDASLHVQMALKFQLALRGPLTVFSAYGNFAHLPQLTRQGCQKTGVNLIDIPHGTKDTADKAILLDMFLFALDNPPPCTLVLITGDVDLAPALHKLGRRGYSVVLVAPSGRKVSPALLNACHHLLSWPDIASRKCTLSMHNVLLQPSHLESYTFPSVIQCPEKIAATCAGTLGNMPSEAVGTVVGSFGAEGSTSSKSELRDNRISRMITPNAQVCTGCEVKDLNDGGALCGKVGHMQSQHFTNIKRSKAAGKGQHPSLQLKVKKTKMKKTQTMTNVEAAPAAAPKLTKEGRKSAELNSYLEHVFRKAACLLLSM